MLCSPLLPVLRERSTDDRKTGDLGLSATSRGNRCIKEAREGPTECPPGRCMQGWVTQECFSWLKQASVRALPSLTPLPAPLQLDTAHSSEDDSPSPVCVEAAGQREPLKAWFRPKGPGCVASSSQKPAIDWQCES